MPFSLQKNLNKMKVWSGQLQAYQNETVYWINYYSIRKELGNNK